MIVQNLSHMGEIMMKKTTSALAVAALMTAGTASAMEEFVVNETTTASIFGGIYVGASNVEQGDGSTESDVFDNGTTLGFVFESRLPNGMSAFAHLEEDGFDAADDGSTDNFTDEAYFGLRGGFGEVLFGRNDAIYGDLISGHFNYQEVFAPTAFDPTREGVFQFRSSDMSGFSVALEAEITGDGDEALQEKEAKDAETATINGTSQVTALAQEAEFTNGEDGNGVSADSVSLAAAASYTFDAVTVTGAIDQRGNDTGSFGGSEDFYVDSPIYGLVGSVDLNPLVVSVGYQKAEEADTAGAVDTDIFSVDAQYAYTNGSVYGTYQAVDTDNADDRDEVSLGATYGVGQIYGFVEYIAFDRAQDADDAVSVGGGYNF